MKIPLVDLKIQHKNIRNELIQAIEAVLDTTAFIGGNYVEEFEKKFANYCDVKHGISCSSGTSALHLALLSCGIKPGDEVITVAHTFFATTEAILQAGGIPVYVDIDPETFGIDPAKIEVCISKKTKAIIVVHLYGQCVNMDPVLQIAKRYNLLLIEDAAQAHGALYKGKKAGSMGDVACFSFYPGKNLGACGDAGMVVCNDDDKAKLMRSLRDHGRLDKYEHSMPGYNYRMDGMQAAILDVKLNYLEDWINKRREVANLYRQNLSLAEIKLPEESHDSKHAYHLFVIRTSYRNELQEYLKTNGVSTGVHYPIPLHLQPACKFLNYKNGDLPETEKASEEILSLPMYPELTPDQVNYICDHVKSFFKTHDLKSVA